MILFAFFLLIFSLFPARVFAIYDPLSVPNNKFGIHTVEAQDIPEIPKLVNSTGGDWGYVTLVIGENDRNPDKWQKVFDQMRGLRLIPIVRIATHIEGSSWTKPKSDSFREWVDFLNKLTWVIKNRYVILFNEPNHANEWGGSINPEEYADRFVDLAKQLKDASPDFFILPAGLDASAANDGEAMDEANYLRRMIAEKPDIARFMDGWTSHSYPNPGFSGSPYAGGRGSMRTFQWELDYLRQLGIQKTLPVFITETGWIHSEGKIINPSLLTPEKVGENLKIAASSAWTDPRIAAITPFVFNYQGLPFDHFSWKKLGTGDYYAQYGAYQSIPKQKGTPKKKEQYELLAPIFPPKLVTQSNYTFSAPIKNTGEAILDPADDYVLSLVDSANKIGVTVEQLPTLAPGETGTITIHARTAGETGPSTLTITIAHNGSSIPLTKQDVVIGEPPSLELSLQLGWRTMNNADNVTVLIYKKDSLIQKFPNLTLKNGKLTVNKLMSIVPNETYRIVAIVPYYLPRQAIVALGDKQTKISLKRLLPLDINNDGAFTVGDIAALLSKQPNQILPLFFGP